MTLYPTSLRLDFDILGEELSQITRDWIENLMQLGFPSVVAWSCPSPRIWEPMHPGGLEEALQSFLLTVADADKSNKSFSFDLEDGSSAWVFSKRNRGYKDAWPCGLIVYITERNASQITEFIQAATELCRYFLKKGQLHKAELYRFGGGLSIPPDPPLAGNRNTLIVTTQLEVEQNYEHPEVFFSAWDNIEQYGDKYLLMRGLDCRDDVSFLSHTIQHQWAMARAAKPGLTKYFLARPKPEEIPIFQTEESYLNTVGYIPAQRVVEYACWVDPDFHIQGWEIYNIWELIQVKQLEDGSPVDTVRVVFPNREMAEREKRPLLDIGAQVWYYNPLGETEQIIE